MHHELIKALIRMAGSTPAAIARDLGISQMTVSHVIRGSGTSARVAKRVAEVTGKTAAELFPGRYPTLENAGRRKSSRRTASSEAAK